jgi:hypothetical protein
MSDRELLEQVLQEVRYLREEVRDLTRLVDSRTRARDSLRSQWLQDMDYLGVRPRNLSFVREQGNATEAVPYRSGTPS